MTIDTAAAIRALYPLLASIPASTLANAQTGVPAFAFVDPGYTRQSILGYPIGPNWNPYDLVDMSNIMYSLFRRSNLE